MGAVSLLSPSGPGQTAKATTDCHGMNLARSRTDGSGVSAVTFRARSSCLICCACVLNDTEVFGQAPWFSHWCNSILIVPPWSRNLNWLKSNRHVLFVCRIQNITESAWLTIHCLTPCAVCEDAVAMGSDHHPERRAIVKHILSLSTHS